MNYEIIHGDCLKELERAPEYQTIITDPIWPNHKKVFDIEDPAKLLLKAISNSPRSVKRVVIVMGNDSDPRFLSNAIPHKYPFLKSCFLEFCVPVRKGRNLYTNLVAYVFGEWPKAKKGQQLIPTKVLSRETEKRLSWHPTPLRLTHCKWLVKWLGEGGVIDPFAGSASIGIACKQLRQNYWGCEINPDYYQKAKQRLDEEPEPWC